MLFKRVLIIFAKKGKINKNLDKKIHTFSRIR